MQTKELVAGRELDALVAEKVMGIRIVRRDDNGWSYYIPSGKPLRTHAMEQRPVPSYSSEISAAWQVLDAMVWRVGTANIRLDMEDYGRGFLNDEGAERAVWVTIGEWTVCGPAPLAICKAALAALDG